MFALTVHDHVRLNSEQCAQNYTVHARAAERLARYALRIRLTVLALVTLAAAAATVSALVSDPRVRIAAAVSGLIALAAYAAYLTFGFEARVIAHRTFAHRVWLLNERHLSLLSEIADGRIDQSTILARRDELIQQSHAIYEHGFAADQVAHETVRSVALAPQATATASPASAGG